MIPNRAARWSSAVFFLIGLFGLYGVLAEPTWPPGWRDVPAAAGVVIAALLGVEFLRTGVLVQFYGTPR